MLPCRLVRATFPDFPLASSSCARSASPAVIGGRGLKQGGLHPGAGLHPASPAVIGGRGLKLDATQVIALGAQASPAVIGGRGLKPVRWVALSIEEPASPAVIGGRGLKPVYRVSVRGNRNCIARRHRRAWVETDVQAACLRAHRASPAVIGGRGLKLASPLASPAPLRHRPPSSAGVG